MGLFRVYQSAAGSGKTYTLVKEYLGLVLQQEDPLYFRHVLAITFTNKAANEMKERVLESLHVLSAVEGESNYDEHYLIAVSTEADLDATQVQARATAVLEQMLHHYGDLAIGTIDKFVHRVVRTFARDLRIPLDFDVELDADNLLTKSIDLLITRVGNDEHLTKTLVDFAEQKAADDKSWHIEQDLHAFSRNLLRDESDPFLNQLRKLGPAHFLKVRQQLDDELRDFENGIQEIGQAALELTEQAGISPTLLAGGNRGVGVYFKNLATLNLKKVRPSNAIVESVAKGQWAASKANAADKYAIQEIGPQLSRLFNQAQTFLDNRFERYQLLKLVHTHLYALSVLNELDKVIADIKRDSNILLIADFNRKISEIVRNEPAPFIYERLGDRYHHYLIDEFQDTSVMQWQNLLPLVENALSNGHRNLVVGDGKQAIYRWRGGEVEQFASLPEVYEHHDEPMLLDKQLVLKTHYEAQHLDTNWRSKKAIVDFNNEFFRQVSALLHDQHVGIYELLEQKVSPKFENHINTGYVTVEQVEPAEEQTQHEAYLEEVRRLVMEALEDGYRPSDVAVLVRKNQHGSEVAHHLLKHQIQVVSSESLLLNASPEVNFIIEIFRLARDPGDSLAQANAVRYLVDTQLHDLNFHEAITQWSDWANDEEKTRYIRFGEFLKDNGYDYRRYRTVQQPLYQSVEDLIRVFKLAPKPNAFLQFFLDAVHGFALRSGNNLNDFLAWWEKKGQKTSILVPEGTDAVRILTIHKAKGLQFPVVIVPFANWRITNGRSDLWLDLQDEIDGLEVALVPTRNELGDTRYGPLLEEEKNKSLLDDLNLLYVAFTRPEDRLHILTNVGKRGTVAQYITETLPIMEGWKIAEQRLRMGERIPHSDLHLSTEGMHEIQHFPSAPWSDKLTISFQAPSLWHEAGNPSTPFDALVCTALGRLKNTAQIPELTARFRDEGLLNDDTVDHFEDQLSEAAIHPSIQPFFEEGFEAGFRQELIDEKGAIYRPGRIFRQGDKAIIADFKAGKRKEEHREQLYHCGKLLRQMGYAEISLHLCYYQGMPEVETVPC